MRVAGGMMESWGTWCCGEKWPGIFRCCAGTAEIHWAGHGSGVWLQMVGLQLRIRMRWIGRLDGWCMGQIWRSLDK